MIAGHDLEAARRIAKGLGEKPTAAKLDVLEKGRFAALAANTHFVVDSAGPEWVVGIPAVR